METATALVDMRVRGDVLIDTMIRTEPELADITTIRAVQTELEHLLELRVVTGEITSLSGLDLDSDRVVGQLRVQVADDIGVVRAVGDQDSLDTDRVSGDLPRGEDGEATRAPHTSVAEPLVLLAVEFNGDVGSAGGRHTYPPGAVDPVEQRGIEPRQLHRTDIERLGEEISGRADNPQDHRLVRPVAAQDGLEHVEVRHCVPLQGDDDQPALQRGRVWQRLGEPSGEALVLQRKHGNDGSVETATLETERDPGSGLAAVRRVSDHECVLIRDRHEVIQQRVNTLEDALIDHLPNHSCSQNSGSKVTIFRPRNRDSSGVTPEESPLLASNSAGALPFP